MKRMCILLSLLIMLMGLSVSAHPALVDMGDGTIYDADTQLSWLKDADSIGLQNWTVAVAWTASLNNSGGFAGLTGWRLPNADPTCTGAMGGAVYNCINDEMGHLYYTELGNAAYGPLTNTGPFTNLNYAYWTGTDLAWDPSGAWAFIFLYGNLDPGNKESALGAWAVRPGARTVTYPITTASPAGSNYSSAQNVTLTCNDGFGLGCQITYYCLGSGCNPTTVFNGAISIASSTVLSFYSRDNANNSETIRTESYAIDTVAHPALVDMGDGTIYDADTQLSWLKDANYASTSGYTGGLTWDQAVAWTASLNNSGGFAGLTGWRLPNADPNCNNGIGIGYNCTSSEMGHLYYTELGNSVGGSLTNTGPFTNLQTSPYWSGTEYEPNPSDAAWYFSFSWGTQGYYGKAYHHYRAWAVRSGARTVTHTTTCGSTVSYGGVTYNTVLIGTQCWFKENLNVGTMIGNTETPDNTSPTLNDPNTVSKWCFYDSSSYCSSEGGLYTWAEANVLPNSCNSTYCSVPTPNQGICPAGWHIPTDAELYTLENYLKIPGQTCDATRNGWDCSDAGTKLIISGSSGFDALGAGNHETVGDGSFFDKREPSVNFWSSSEQPVIPSYAWHRTLVSLVGGGDVRVFRGSYLKAFGFSVRCLADTFFVDSTPPTTTASPSGGTYTSAQTVDLNCNDTGGSGCQSTYYCLGEGCDPTTPNPTGSISISSSTHLRFYSIDNANNSEEVNEEVYTINLPDTAPPTIPANLQANAISSSQIDLSWNASSDNVGVTGYSIYNADTNVSIATTTQTTYPVTGLNASTTYRFYVTAYDAANNESNPSNTASATTYASGNTPVGSDVHVDLGNGITIIFERVVSPGTTTTTVLTNPGHNPPLNFRVLRGLYYNITTTASYSGTITIIFPYEETGNENNLKILHWESPGGWNDVTVQPVDTANNMITAHVSSLSPFVIGYYLSSGGYSTGANENMIAVIAILAISAGLFILRRNKWIKAC